MQKSTKKIKNIKISKHVQTKYIQFIKNAIHVSKRCEKLENILKKNPKMFFFTFKLTFFWNSRF